WGLTTNGPLEPASAAVRMDRQGAARLPAAARAAPALVDPGCPACHGTLPPLLAPGSDRRGQGTFPRGAAAAERLRRALRGSLALDRQCPAPGPQAGLAGPAGDPAGLAAAPDGDRLAGRQLRSSLSGPFGAGCRRSRR